MHDVIVVGAGHAGCEAALAAARMGCRTLLLTLDLDSMALMPCNPSIGGPAKGHVVREIDALGGEMARNIDKAFIQIRCLNTSRGPAVQALRAQADKRAYQDAMRRTLETQPNLALKQALVDELIIEQTPVGKRAVGVRTSLGTEHRGKVVVLTTGTSMRGRVIIGDVAYSGGRSGEAAAVRLSENLAELGFELRRLKTGTPPRLDSKTIDFSLTQVQWGSESPLFFSAWARKKLAQGEAVIPPFVGLPASPAYPHLRNDSWRPQLPCYQVRTNADTHQAIRENLDRAPLFSGLIDGVGPRYCPSIEDKVVRFADKDSHTLFLEPEGWNSDEVYVQGANTSLPEDVQLRLLRTIPALRSVEMTRVGYAIEYDAVSSHQIKSNLETSLVSGLFLAGQINGTSGYEEAAGQGLVAGINAALSVQGREALLLRRDQAYIGVMIDDLVTGDIREPYRLFTSRAEFRLLLRHDNADLRLSAIGHQLGLIDEPAWQAVEFKRRSIEEALAHWGKAKVPPSTVVNDALTAAGLPCLTGSVPALDLLRRNGYGYQLISELLGSGYPDEVLEQVELAVKYDSYIGKQLAEVERVIRLEKWRVPSELDYGSLSGLRTEARQRLTQHRPATLGQCSRIAGVTPSDVSVLMVHLTRASVRGERAQAELADTGATGLGL